MPGFPRFLFLVVCSAFVAVITACGSGSGSPDFTLTTGASTVTIAAGSTATVTVTANAVSGSKGTISVALTGLPNGVTVSPASFTLSSGASQSLTITAASNATPGNATITISGTSGSISHTVMFVLAVAAPPPPDFSLSATPAAATLKVGGTTQISLLAMGGNGFSSPVMVSLSGLPAGVTASTSTLTLTPGTAQTVTLTAAASATAGNATLTFTGTSGALTHTATVALTVAAAAQAGPDVTTYHYGNNRQGLNAQETILTHANVNATSFGKLGFYQVDGKVDAQPLYVGGLPIQTQVTNVLYVVTEHDSVYALNAATGAQIWKTSVLGANETTSDSRNCGQIVPEIGITSTPVIDRKQGPNGTIFVVGMTKDASGKYHQRLHALDLTTGAEQSGSPTEIQATYPGTGANSTNGMVVFDPKQYAERAGLLLLNGNIYTAWTSHCDIQPYTGWVIGYNESTLQQSTVINLTPNGSDGSIWMAGFGIAADDGGNIYFLDANGTFDGSFDANGFPTSSDYGNGIIKLSTAGGKLAVSDYFEPFNTMAESAADTDLGSGGAMLLPDVADQSGAVRHLIVGAGKDGNIYVADRDNMGKFNQRTADNSNLYLELPGALPNGAWSGPAYFNGAVYYGSVGGVLRAFTITNAKLSATPTSTTKATFAYPGTTPSVSANGTQNGIVWALESGESAPYVLHAYDPANLANEFYNSNQAANGRDNFGNGNKFITPMVANGRVYVGTPTGVAVFGLLP
jgi:hypothetical protein